MNPSGTIGILSIGGADNVESHLRSIAKAMTWRAGGTVVTFAVAWFLTHQLELAAQIGILDTIVKIGAFYGHERIWNRLQFGKPKPPEYQI
ncbi:MAG: DUF2061 domain-containing protein [Planctomycetota bacterium]